MTTVMVVEDDPAFLTRFCEIRRFGKVRLLGLPSIISNRSAWIMVFGLPQPFLRIAHCDTCALHSC